MNTYQAFIQELKNLQKHHQRPERSEIRGISKSQVHSQPPELTEKRLNSNNSGACSGVFNIFQWVSKNSSWDSLDVLPDDIRWLENLLHWKTTETKISLLNKYHDTWITAMACQSLPQHQRQSTGRTAANNWIREKVQCKNKQNTRISTRFKQ